MEGFETQAGRLRKGGQSVNRNPELCDQLGMTVSSVNNNKNKTSRRPGENE